MAVFHSVWLAALGNFLVKAEPPVSAEAAVVLAGDAAGDRLRKGIELLRAGYVPFIAVSGPCCFYGRNEGELAVEMAIGEGAKREWFVVVPMEAYSTREESDYIVRFLRERKISSFLLITSDYHTRRSGRVYRRKAADISFRVVASRERRFQSDRWWHMREGQKVFLAEWQKTVADWLGI